MLTRLAEGEAAPPSGGLASVGTVRRVVRLGFEVRVELLDSATGAEVVAQITRGELDHLHLLEGDRVLARATRVPDVAPAPSPVPPATAPPLVAQETRAGGVAVF